MLHFLATSAGSKIDVFNFKMPALVTQSDAPLTGDVWQHSFMEFDREIFSMVILFLQLIQEQQLSVSDERMYTNTA